MDVNMDRSSLRRGRAGRIAVIAAAALALAAPVGFAQTPEAEMAMADGPHPAHIHSGTCDELGDVVAPLTDVAARQGEATGAASAVPVESSHTVVPLALEDIIAGGHAINVHLSAEEIDQYIACGDIGGVTYEEGGRTHLIVGLRELNGSGHVGVAWLGSQDDGSTEVSVTLFESDRER